MTGEHDHSEEIEKAVDDLEEEVERWLQPIDEMVTWISMLMFFTAWAAL